MSDLVKHLRAGAADGAHPLTLLSEAADEIDRLRAELAEARRDAERYRWLRNVASGSDWLQMAEMTPEATESWIDAALSPTQAAGE